jgi:hypothetical protein
MWRLPDGEILDLAVDPRLGDVYVIVGVEVLRYAADGTLLARYTQAQLNLVPETATPPSVTATPTADGTRRTATPPCPPACIDPGTATPTPTPSATVSATVADTPFASPGVTTPPPTATPSPSPPPTARPNAIFLPFLARAGFLTDGMHIVEVATLIEPGVSWRAAAVDGSVAYAGAALADGRSQLVAFDLRPGQPPLRSRGRIILPDTPQRLATTGGILVATSRSAIFVVDATDPERLRLVAQIPANGALGVEAREGYAYVRDAGGNMVNCNDLEGLPPGDPTAMAGEGAWPSAWLRILDLRTRDAPRVIGELPIQLEGAPCLADVALTGSRLFLAAQSAGLVVVDIADPTAPRLLRTLLLPSGADSLSVDPIDPGRLWIATRATEDYVSVAPRRADDPAALPIASAIHLPALTRADDAFVRSAATRDGLAVADRGRLWHLDTTGDRPRQVDRFDLAPKRVEDLAADLGYVVLAAGGDGLILYAAGEP